MHVMDGRPKASHLSFVAALAAAACGVGCDRDRDEFSPRITVTGQRLTPTRGKVMVSAGYMVLHNAGPGADRLVAASSPKASAVEIHASVMDGDVARMRYIETLELPPGVDVTFKPGGYHLMVYDPAERLSVGQRFPVTLVFASAGRLQLDFPVQDPPPDTPPMAGVPSRRQH